ncbi:MAG: hypothetical protein KDM64_03285 [Verrucomicrobiae bacterium]|nr:hypothetical protein [Verrucomicrobiae bacterium]
MNRYRQSIIFFGGVIPFIILGVLLGSVLYGRSKLHATKEVKEAAFEKYQAAAGAVSYVEEELQIEGRAEQMAYWEDQLKGELVQSLTQNLNEIASQFTEDQLARTEFGRPGTQSALAGGTKNPHSRFRLSFEGGFGPMQTLLAELETRMPQLTLEGLDISPISDADSKSKGKLRFDVTYLAWQDYSNTK